MYLALPSHSVQSSGLADRCCQPVAANIPVSDLLPLVAAAFHIDVSRLRSQTRDIAGIAFARQVGMYLAHTLLGLSYNEVATAFQRDRTTVQHACGLVEDRRDDAQFDALISQIEEQILSLKEARNDDAR